jgi:hypothetical protein
MYIMIFLQERMTVEIDADAGFGLGIFNHIGERKSAAQLADVLRSNSARYYGTAINAYR